MNLSDNFNILITGANGQLGMELRRAAEGSPNRFIFTDINEVPGVATTHLDITDRDAVMRTVSENSVHFIVNCAAYTDVERAETDSPAAFKINRDAVGNIAEAARANNAILIHISTDYVFDGRAAAPYTETSTPSPTCNYGFSKLAGERLINDTSCNALIIRTSGLYSPYGNNFVKTMLSLFREKEFVNVVSDQISTPTYAADLAGLLCKIIDGGLYPKPGLYHFSNEGSCSWYEFACAVSELRGNKHCIVNPCTTEEYSSKAKRPKYSVLDKTKVRETFGVEIPHWRDSLKECLARIESIQKQGIQGG